MRMVSQTLVAAALVLHVVTPSLAQTGSPVSHASPSVERVAPRVNPAPRERAVSFASLFADLGRDLTRLPSKGTAVTLGIGGALALAVHPADRELTRRATLSVPLDHAFEVGESAGSGWIQAGGAFGTFLIAKATRNQRAQVLGADLVRAQMISSAITQGLKLSVSRPRPDAGRFSFPSGHASGTFANATVLYRHFGWKVGVPAYGLASYVAASRLQENQHYASDVIVGAAIGIVAGRSVTVGRGASRFAISPMAAPSGAGVMFVHVP